MEIGERLKEARESRSLTLESIQETTKIQKRYLTAIERGDFHILPGKFYARAFIKEYANAVGLNADELLAEHQSEIPTADENDSAEYRQTRRSRHSSAPAKSSTVFSLIPTIIVVLLVIGIFFVAWTLVEKATSDDPVNPVEDQDNDSFVRNEDETDSTSDPDEDHVETDNEEDTDDKDDAEPEKENKTDPEFNLVEKGTGNSPESILELNNLEEDIQVSLTFTGETYLQVVSGNNESLLEGMFSEDDSPTELEVNGEDQIYFNIGNAKSLTLSINGVELEYPVDPASSVHQKLWINFNTIE